MCVCVLLHRGGAVNQSPRSRRTPGEWGSAVRKVKRALLLESCLAFFMAHPSCFVGNMHISELEMCLPKAVYCGHMVVLALRGTTADTSLSCNNSYPSKSSWLQYINPLFFMSVDRLADVFNIQAETVNDETNLDLRSFVGGLMWERICLYPSLYCCPKTCLHPGGEEAWTRRGRGDATKDKPSTPLHPFLILGCLLGCLIK